MSTIPESIKKALLKALGRVPQRVLLKYEDEMEDKPKNIMTKQWLPQRDILCKYLIIQICNIIFIITSLSHELKSPKSQMINCMIVK